ncbi:DUF4240 domain-containing protein [Embleya hyalina]|uniref:DUF4240 domain-containing protein n=1 Tax=Embleya hyalina TaxID=516124 RepID=A0A401YVK5_9ACTN|nr:DUF4240 domain-containing protein [Embleya hyalina]GCD98637.1 hypothetical protein EHYA_06348 [Embleya hyalina]
MDMDDFWALVEAARAADGPYAPALVDILAAHPPERILDYDDRFHEARDALYRWDLWAAAHLIGGGCSDDAFMDFRAGLIALGREAYEDASRDPDGLAGLPVVLAEARAGGDEAIFDEDANYCAMGAFERLTGDEEAFDRAWALRPPTRAGGVGPYPAGEDFDFDDDAEMRRRLPRLAALFRVGAEG